MRGLEQAIYQEPSEKSKYSQIKTNYGKYFFVRCEYLFGIMLDTLLI